LISASTATKAGHVNLRSVDNMRLTARPNPLLVKAYRRYQTLQKYPARWVFELTSRCNLKCPICRREGFTDYGNMDIALYCDLLEQLKPWRQWNTSISFSGFGEPLLCADLEKFIYHSPVPISINTNGYRLPNQWSKLIKYLDHKDIICISLNAQDETTYKAYSGSDNYEELKETIISCLSTLLSQRHFKVNIQVLDKEPTQDFVHYWEKWLKAGDKIVFHKMINWGDGQIKANHYPCFDLWDSIHFDWHGNSYLCCEGIRRRQTSLMRVSSDQFRRHLDTANLIRKFHLQGKACDIRDCARCDMYKAFPNIWIKGHDRWL